jgi:apolipoprotein N-acyltransferase
MKKWLVNGWPCLLSAILLLLAFPPFNLAFLSFVALVPWLISLRTTTRRGAWKSGYFFGFLYGLGQLYWIGVLTYRWTHSPLLMVLPWILSALAFALYFGWAGIQIEKAWSRGHYWLIPLLWTGIEVFRSYIPVFAFPYALSATPLWRYPALIQTSWFGMSFLVTAWIVLANVLIVLLIFRDRGKQTIGLGVSFLLLLAISLARYSLPERGDSLTVSAVQPGVDMAFGDPRTEFSRLEAAIPPLIREAAAEDTGLIVLPEGVASAATMPPVLPFQPGPIPTVFGARRGTSPAYQSAFGFDGTFHFVDKTRLVIFGEFVPGRDYFPFIAEAFSLPTGDMSAGPNGTQPMKLGGLTLGPIICFEGLFPEVAYRQAMSGAQLLTVVSIDDWYLGTPAPEQLRAASIFRAAETGTPLVRSASLGYSLICDSKGRVLEELALREPGVATDTVRIHEGSGVFGGSPAFAVLSLLTLLAFGWLPGRTSSRNPD